MEIDIPEVVAEVRAAFAAYERALVANDVAALDAMFWDNPRTIRFGSTENLLGYAADQGVPRCTFPGRARPHAVGHRHHRLWPRCRDCLDLFRRPSTPGKVGRQMQTWMRFPEGWRVVAAHVSIIAET